MAEFTLKNLKEIDDAAVKGGMSPDIEFRVARDELDTAGAAISYQRLAPNFRIPFGHSHETQEEVYVVLAGSGKAKLEDEVVDLRQWDALRVPKDTTRGFEAGPDGIEFLIVGAPRTGANDAIPEPDWWTD